MAIDASRLSPVFQDETTRPSAAALGEALETLLERHPDAPVAALRGDGVMVEMPDAVPLRGNPVLSGRAGQDMVEVDEESLAGWERILTHGAAVYSVHPAGRPDATWTLYGLDLRESHGIIFMLTVPSTQPGGKAGASTTASSDFVVRPPRLATVRKDELAFIRVVDDAAVQMLGWEADDIVGHRSLEFIHPDDQVLARDAWMEMLANPGPPRRVRMRHRRQDGSWLWVEITNENRLADADYGCVITEMVDITGEMAAHELLNRLAETVPVGLLQLDWRGEVVYSNDRLHEILGVARTQSAEEQIASIIPEHQQLLRDAFDRAVRDGEPADLEVELRHPDSGGSRFCTVGLRPLTGGGASGGGAIACIADVTDSMQLREELRHRSMYDELTGCLNRRTIVHALQQQLLTGDEHSTRAVMFIDLDCFKPINDEHGHAAGDELLREVAARLRGALREGDTIGRMGGDEFLVLCPDVATAADAVALAERVAEVQRKKMKLASLTLQTGVSVGVSWSRGTAANADELVAQADEAMYECKEEGRGRPKLYRSGRAATRSGVPRRQRASRAQRRSAPTHPA